MEEAQDIVINGVSVVTIADYAKRRHLKVSFVQNHLIKGDDQNEPVKPVYKLGNTGMYSIEELDAAYLTRGSKGITLASMGYLHPAKAAEMESRIRELVGEKAELVAEKAAILEIGSEVEISLQESETELEDVKARTRELEATLRRVESNYEKRGAELDKYRELLDEQEEIIKSLQAKVRKYEDLALENGRNMTDAERANEVLRSAITETHG